jgi:hypothetical protein
VRARLPVLFFLHLSTYRAGCGQRQHRSPPSGYDGQVGSKPTTHTRRTNYFHRQPLVCQCVFTAWAAFGYITTLRLVSATIFTHLSCSMSLSLCRDDAQPRGALWRHGVNLAWGGSQSTLDAVSDQEDERSKNEKRQRHVLKREGVPCMEIGVWTVRVLISHSPDSPTCFGTPRLKSTEIRASLDKSDVKVPESSSWTFSSALTKPYNFGGHLIFFPTKFSVQKCRCLARTSRYASGHH